MPNGRHAELTDEEAGLELAERLEQFVSGERAVVVVFGGCWMLASTIVQALVEREDPDIEADPLTAIEVVCRQLGRCVAELLAARQVTKQ